MQMNIYLTGLSEWSSKLIYTCIFWAEWASEQKMAEWANEQRSTRSARSAKSAASSVGQIAALWPPFFWHNTWTESDLLHNFYDMFQIIKIFFSFIIRNIFWRVGAVFKYINPCFMKKFISLLIISSILQQYLHYISNLWPLIFNLCQHVSILA